MSLQGSKELIANLNLIQNWTAVELKVAMSKALSLISRTAKANHLRGKSLSRDAVKSHDDDRFYTWSGNLTGSIHSHGSKQTPTGISGAVSVSEAYAERVELGGAGRRAFPFLGPALDDNGDEIMEMFAVAVKKVVGK